MSDLFATPENMKKVEGVQGIFAYSPTTGEQSSATPGDYFWAAPDEVLLDSEDQPMILATERCVIKPLTI